MAKNKERLDILLVERGLVSTRSRAKAFVMAGEVLVNGQRVDKPGTKIARDAKIQLIAPMPYVSRGGYKLAGALDLSPYPFAVAVLIAASAAYSTPISTPVVTLVVEPGRYKFADFVRTGVPLLLLTYVVTLVVTPLIFPFYPG